jgi:hypothetical protein
MSTAALPVALRAAAIAIAAIAILDPAILLDAASRQPIVMVQATDNSTVGEDLRRLNAGDGIVERSLVNRRVPCGVDERCVLVADGSVDAHLPGDLERPVLLVVASEPVAPNVGIRSVAMPARPHVAAAGVASVVLDGKGMAGRRSEVRLIDGEAVVGSVVHEWASDGQAPVDVAWWPLGAGARAVRVVVDPVEGETAAFDNAIDVGVDVAAEPTRVLVFEARPSWQSTFVRRALEDDPRYRVAHRARLAPAISAGTAEGRIDAQSLGNADALVLSGLDALTADDVDRIEAFVRAGGAAILLPDRAPSGEAARLFAGDWRERLGAEAVPVGALRAGEVLAAAAVPPTSTVMARAGDAPAIVATPLADGLVIVAGAMDAWRHRDADAGAFDRFWRSLAAEAAAAARPMRITFNHQAAEQGSRLPFTVRGVAASDVSAVARCGNGPAQTVRLWPAPAPDVLRGELITDERGACTLEVVAGDRRAVAGVAVIARASRSAPDVLERLERDVRSRGGSVARDGDLSRMATALDTGEAGPADRLPVYPMRSAWWIVPFAALLSTEWWYRRRAGLH